ncbi:MAG: two-component system LytT family sensor kinase [Crocinitomix sp.]|jgi:two-component system LytT family sensor kinase
MNRLILFLYILAFSLNSLASTINYDSLLVIARNADDRQAFKVIESLIRTEENEYSTSSGKELIIYCSSRTKELNFEFLHGQFRFHESIINTVHGDIGVAMKMANESLIIFSKYHTIEAARCYNTMGSMTAGLGNYETALEYLRKADLICEHFKEAPRYSYMHCDNLLVTAYIYILAKDYDNAIIYMEQCLDLGQKIGYNLSVNSCYLNFSDVYRLQHKYPEAIEMAERSILLSNDSGASNLACVGQYRKGQIFYDMGEHDSSLYYYHNAEEIGIKQNINLRLLGIYKACTQIYTEEKQFDKASEYQARYINLSAEVAAQDRDSRLEMLQIKFNVDEKISQINSLALENDFETDRNKLLTIAIVITVAAFVLLIFIIILIFNRYRLNRKIQIERQQKEMSHHQMTSLKSQMNPHFTFNALNSIQDLILKEDTEESYNYIAKFADLIRNTLNHSSQEFIDIEDEITSLQLYLELEKLRFDNDLTIEFESIGINHILIPPLLIQPFIENSIKHGLFHKEGPKHLRVQFKLKEDLICTISDNGIGREASQEIQKRRIKNHTSFALNSIEERFKLLRQVYGNNLGVTYIDLKSDLKATGTTVVISLPFKPTH